MVNLSHIRTYCEVSSLACLHYCVDGMKPLHRFFWLVIFILFSCLGFQMIINNWRIWEEKPDISTVSKVPYTRLAFPAVTVCPAGSTPWISYQNIMNQIKVDSVVEKALPLTLKQALTSTLDATNVVFDKTDILYDILGKLEPKISNPEFYFPKSSNMFEEWVYKVDVQYQSDCGSKPAGPYCYFHNSITQIMATWQNSQIFKDYVKSLGGRRYTIADFFTSLTQAYLEKMDTEGKKSAQLIEDYLAFLKGGKFAGYLPKWTDAPTGRKKREGRQERQVFDFDDMLFEDFTDLEEIRWKRQVTVEGSGDDASTQESTTGSAEGGQEGTSTEAEPTTAEGGQETTTEDLSVLEVATSPPDYGPFDDYPNDDSVQPTAECSQPVIGTNSEPSYYDNAMDTATEFVTEAKSFLDKNKAFLKKPICKEIADMSSFMGKFGGVKNMSYSTTLVVDWYLNISMETIEDFKSSLSTLGDNLAKDQSKCKSRPMVIPELAGLSDGMGQALTSWSALKYPDRLTYSICEPEYISGVPGCIPYSQYDDKFAPEFPIEAYNYCNCKCEKVFKLQIFKVFQVFNNFLGHTADITYLGEVLAWFFKDELMRNTVWNVQAQYPRANAQSNAGTIRNRLPKDWNYDHWGNISKELLNFDIDFLNTVFGIKLPVATHEFISLLSLPPDFMENPYDFPRLTSLPTEVRNEIFGMYNYSTRVRQPGNQRLKPFNFYNRSDVKFSHACSAGAKSPMFNRMRNYCNQIRSKIKTLELSTIFQLMKFANHPSLYDTTLPGAFPKYTKDTRRKKQPQSSFIPFCSYGNKSHSYWTVKDITLGDLDAGESLEEFQKRHELENPYLYRFPPCQSFHQRPTDLGLCHTFNGLNLSSILASSEWLQSYQDVFYTGETGNQAPLNFTGSGLDQGLVFAVDTMQSERISKEKKESVQEDTSRFWIKVHNPGDLARLLDQDPATWQLVTKQDPTSIANIAVKLQGEFSVNTEDFRDIRREARKCLLSDEGHLELFDYYTHSNCILECHWKKAEDICGCLPWYIPRQDDYGQKTCFILGNLCFASIMKTMEAENGGMKAACDCPDDCIGGDYSFSVEDNQNPEEVISLCDTDSTGCFSSKTEGYYGTSPTQKKSECACQASSDAKKEPRKSTRFYNLADYILDQKYNVHPEEPFLLGTLKEEFGTEQMLRRQSNFFIVSVFLDPQVKKIAMMTRDVVMTMDDKIAWIGGTIGGFNGFCLIGAVEIAYWFLIVLFDRGAKVKPTQPPPTPPPSCQCETRLKEMNNEMELMKIQLKGLGSHGTPTPEVNQAFDAIFAPSPSPD